MLKAVGRFVALFTVPLLTTIWAKNVVIFPYTPSSSTITVYNGDPLSSSPVSTWTVGPYLKFVASNAAGTKYYFGTSERAPQSAVYVVDATNGTTLKQLNFTGIMTYMKLAPDGSRLIVWSGGLHVIDTNGDVAVTPAIGDVGVPVDNGIAFTPDGSRLLVLASLGSAGGKLSAFDLVANALVSTALAIPAAVNAVTVAPTGLAYVSATGGVYEINPQTMAILNTIDTGSGTATTISYTPDGKLGAASALAAQSGPSLFVFDLGTKSVKATSTSAPYFDSLIPVDNTRAIGFSSGNSTIYDIPLNSPNAAVVPTWGGVNYNGTVRGVAASDEVPPRYVYVLTLGTLYRADVKALAVSGQATVNIPQAYRLQTVGGVSTNQAASLLAYNNNQSLTTGSAAMNLIARALDIAGRPVKGATVTFTTANAAVVLATPNVITNADGFAQTAVTVPATAGVYTITGQSGPASQPYTINVGTSTGGGGGNTGGGGSTAAGLTILSGQGQVFRGTLDNTYLAGFEPLVVQLLDSAGNPIPNANLSWTSSSPSGSVVVTSTVTDVNGQSENNFSAGFVTDPTSIVPVSVVVSDGNGHTVTFLLTVLGNPPGNSQSLPGVNGNILIPVTHNFTGGAGTIQEGALKMQISTNWGAPLQNIVLKLVSPGDPKATPSASCKGGYALSDANGYATCDVVFGSVLGNTPVSVKFGGGFTFTDFNLSVVPGPPAKIVAVTPAAQSGNPGQALGNNALGIQVQDAGGNPLPGVPLAWSVVPSGAVALTNAFASTNASGQGYATPTLGSIPGAAQVKVIAGSGDNAASFTFTLTVNVQLGGLAYVSGNGQKALVGATFAQPLVVKVTDASGKPVPNVTVNWAITSGVGSMNTSGPTTTAPDGTASVNVTTGSTAGPIVVTASTGSLTPVSFTLNAIPPGPVFAAQDIVNYASGQPGVTPGGIAKITGSNLAVGINGLVVANNGFPGPWPYTLNGVSVRFGEKQAPVYAVSNVNNVQSIIVQVPFELPVGVTTVTISLSGGTGSVDGVQVMPVQPGLFVTTDSSGTSYAVLARSDGSLVTNDNPAHPGEILRMYVTGLGQTLPVTGTNEVGVPGQSVITGLIAGVAAGGTIVTNTEYATGTIGVYIISFQLPPETKPGNNVPVSIAAERPDGSYAFSNTPVIAAVR